MVCSSLLRVASFAECSLELRYHSVLKLCRFGYEYRTRTRQIHCSGCDFILEDLQSSFEEIIMQHDSRSPDCSFSNVEAGLPSLELRGATGSSADSGFEIVNGQQSGSVNPCVLSVSPSACNASQLSHIDVLCNDLKVLFPNGESAKLKETVVSIRERQNRRREVNSNTKSYNSQVMNDSGHPTSEASGQSSPPNLEVFPIPVESEGVIDGYEAVTADYVKKKDRIESFQYLMGLCVEQRNWLFDRNVEMAEAGFYYDGVYGECPDCLRCFFCDVGVRFNKPSLEPWREHARWNCNCKYLQRYKSREFIVLSQKPKKWRSVRYRPPRVLDTLSLTETQSR